MLKSYEECFFKVIRQACICAHTHSPGRKYSGYRYFFFAGSVRKWNRGEKKLSGGVIGSWGLRLQSEQQAVDGT